MSGAMKTRYSTYPSLVQCRDCGERTSGTRSIIMPILQNAALSIQLQKLDDKGCGGMYQRALSVVCGPLPYRQYHMFPVIRVNVSYFPNICCSLHSQFFKLRMLIHMSKHNIIFRHFGDYCMLIQYESVFSHSCCLISSHYQPYDQPTNMTDVTLGANCHWLGIHSGA